MNNSHSLIWGYDLKLTQKIALSGLFIALACILNKVLAVNYIAAIPFVRISFGGPAIIIFSAILLGPIYGGVIGAMQDILGYLVFDIKAFAYSPAITATYFLLGLFAGFMFYFVQKIKSSKITQGIMYSFISILYIGLSLFIILNDSISYNNKTYYINTTMKIAFPIVMLALFAILITFIELSARKHRFDDLPINTYQMALGCFLLEVFVMTLYGSFMKSLLFNGLFPIILFFQTLTMFFNIPFNVIVVSFIMKATKKYY